MDIHMEKLRPTEIKLCPRLHNQYMKNLGVELQSSLSKACVLPKSPCLFPHSFMWASTALCITRFAFKAFLQEPDFQARPPKKITPTIIILLGLLFQKDALLEKSFTALNCSLIKYQFKGGVQSSKQTTFLFFATCLKVHGCYSQEIVS